MKNTFSNSSSSLDELEELLRYKEVFVFDWDGTILDSMEIKSVNFGQAFSCGKGQELADQATHHYLQLSGYPRKQIFFQIMALLKEKAQQDSFQHFNDVFVPQ